MDNSIKISDKQKAFLDYLIQFNKQNHRNLPPIKEISKVLNMSTASLREQLEMAKNLGFISAHPRRGLEILPYRFSPAASKSLFYAVNLDYAYFFQYSEIRSHLEKAFFIESVALLTKSDFITIQNLIDKAFQKLNGNPIQIPHEEHRKYHLAFYSHQKNIFLMGMLEAYWDVYELMGLNLYNDLDYLKNVWTYHRKILEVTQSGDLKAAYGLLGTHMEFIYDRRE